MNGTEIKYHQCLTLSIKCILLMQADWSLKDVLPQWRPFPKDNRTLEVKEEEAAGCGG